jgi:hypothetical protein
MDNGIIMKNIFTVLVYFGISWAVGMQAMNIPSNAHTLSVTSTGIAGGIDVKINPTSILSEKAYIGFSSNNWLGGLSGQQASTHFING